MSGKQTRNAIRRLMFPKTPGVRTVKSFWGETPRMETAWELARWLRNDNGCVRSWVALAQCGMRLTMTSPAPLETAPYGQVVGWDIADPVNKGLSFRGYNGDHDPFEGAVEHTQASVQALWDRLVEYPGIGRFDLTDWNYDPERAALFGDQFGYTEGWQAADFEGWYGFYTLETLLTAFQDQLFDLTMNIVPRSTVRRFIDTMVRAYNARNSESIIDTGEGDYGWW